ncbi:putative proline-rich receptor-like protein kinase PERK13 [Iris pallida]|uniref:Proline-rich receptor-like protein kinase PERK13 n=1 Tax=Iris pallida TaxID=29817 RepID=A0AAX6GAL0_IRIPA|nr:putative proline-rich receptor-like protein kinase PERK13 [Iris pallida]
MGGWLFGTDVLFVDTNSDTRGWARLTRWTRTDSVYWLLAEGSGGGMVAVNVGDGGGNGDDDDDGVHNRKGGCPLAYSKLPALAFPSLGREVRWERIG